MTVHDPVFVFGDFRLDVASRELSRGDETIALQPRVFDLLAYLIAHRDRAVDKNEIQDAVWRGRIVTETALTRAIMKARRAIGDSAERQTLIRTVHGHGYQFVGGIAPSPADVPTDKEDGSAPDRTLDLDQIQTTTPPADVATTRAPARGRVAALGVIVALIVGAAVWLWPAATQSDGVRIAVAPVINNTGDDELAWSSLGLMGVANNLLSTAADLDVVSPGDVVRYTESVDWPSGVDDDRHQEHLRALNRQFGATHVLISVLSRNAGGLRLNYALIDSDGRVDDGTMVSTQSTELVKGVVRSIGSRLTERRHYRDRDLSVTGDPFVDEAYARGMSLALAGRCAEAMPHFDVVTDAVGELTNVRIERATCAQVLGQWQAAQAEFEAVLASLTDAPPSPSHAIAKLGLARVHHRTGRIDSAEALYDEALAAAQAAGDNPVIGRALIGRAILAKDRYQFDAARDLLARSTLAYREAGVEVLPGQLYSTQANIALNDGRLSEADGFLAQALDSFRAAGDRLSEAKILNNYGFLRRVQGRYSEAEPFHLQSLSIREDIGDRVGQGRIHGQLSVLYEALGDSERALDAAGRAVEIAREARDALFLATGLSQRGAAELHLDRLDDALASFTEARDLFASIDDRSRAWQVDVRLAAVDLAAQRLDQADQRAAELIEPAEQAGMHEPAIEARELRGNVAAARGDAQSAIEHYQAALAGIDATGFATSRRGDVLLKLAGLLLDEGDVDAAEPLVGRAVEGESSHGLIRLRARLAFARGDAPRAAQLLGDARTTAGPDWTAADDAALARYQAQGKGAGVVESSR